MKKELKKIIIAIDGHSSCGKSTVAKDIAQRFDLRYVDTGAMYRAVTLFALRKGLIKGQTVDADTLQSKMEEVEVLFKKNPVTGIVETFLNGANVEKEIRTLEISSRVSVVSTFGFVRRRLVQLQQAMGREGGLVMDGRDIGTVVFPNADLKIFMTAAPEIRAKRRYDEMIEKGEQVDFNSVLENVKQRDFIDSTRAESPLIQAPDAWLLDNGHLDRSQQLFLVVEKLKELGWL
ncbi:(d)CMP kinase [Geofilum sp. OHC36d9]|uniref:(d)CMP kinase n=1 Tax=Geofilum sp. OHC36d9 TaxID=3458413 RepID=UPI0040335DF5